MQGVKRRLRPFLLGVPKDRDLWALVLTLLIAFTLAFLGVAINFHGWMAQFFQPHSSVWLVQFLINFLVVWIVVLLVVSYVRWRGSALENRELQDIISSINPDALLIVDTDRNILMANATVERMFGYAASEIIRQKTELLYFDRRTTPGSKREIYDALEEDGFHVGLASGRRKDGQVFPLEIITG